MYLDMSQQFKSDYTSLPLTSRLERRQELDQVIWTGQATMLHLFQEGSNLQVDH